MTGQHPVPLIAEPSDWARKPTTSQALEKAESTLLDSIFATSNALDHLDDDGTKEAIRKMIGERKDSLRRLTAAAARLGITPEGEEPSVSEKLRGGWMKLVAKFSGDDSVVESVLSAEETTRQRLVRCLGHGLDESIEDVIRETLETVQDGMAHLASVNAGATVR